jgi:endoglucanase
MFAVALVVAAAVGIAVAGAYGSAPKATVAPAARPAAGASPYYDSGTTTIPGNPLAGHPWFVDVKFGPLWEYVRMYQHSHPYWAHELTFLAREPATKGFGAFDETIGPDFRAYLARVQQEEPGAIPMVSLSRIAHQSCPYVNPSAEYQPPAYEAWVKAFVNAIGNYPVMVLVEPDRIPTLSCLPPSAQQTRYAELNYDLKLLSKHKNAIVYLDAGASDWVRSTTDLAHRLQRAGIRYAHGFALNASHFDTTAHNIAYGLKVSKLLGGKHFIINTDANGNGPTPPALRSIYHGCQPPNIGAGIRPTIQTGYKVIDAFLWLDTPGYAAGSCIGVPNGAYTFYPQLALKMVRNANPPFK